MPATDWGWEITPEEFEGWIVHRDPEVVAVNKPGGVVCHPSKRGPWSSLVSAAREVLGVHRVHLPSRLDRETSGIVVMALTREAASFLQKAIETREVDKVYYAVLAGRLERTTTVDESIGAAPGAEVVTRQAVVEGGKRAVTTFQPLAATDRHTLVRVRPVTGRMHQIRVHAQWMGHPIVGDKVYGADERNYLRFLADGMTPDLLQRLGHWRHALHAAEISFGGLVYRAPVADDLRELAEKLGVAISFTG